MQDSLWLALKDRKIVKNGVLYLAGAWLTLQFADLLADIWSLPPSFPQIVFIVLVLCLPLVLVLSWIYDLTPHGVERTVDTSFFALLKTELRSRPVLLGSAAAGLFVSLLALVAYTWPDEPLSDDARRLLATLREPDNELYSLDYGLAGFDAPPGVNIWEHGRFVIGNFLVLGEDPEEVGTGFVIDGEDICSLLETGCAAQVLDSLDGIPYILEANALGLARYRELHQVQSFESTTTDLIAPPISFQPLLLGTRLEAYNILHEAEKGDRAVALAQLRAESLFHRRVLQGANNLLTRMIAMRLVENDIRLGALLLQRAAEKGEALAPELLLPLRLSPAERSLASILATEGATNIRNLSGPAGFRLLDNGQDDLSVSMRAGLLLLPLQPNASTNRWVERVMDTIQSSLIPADEFMRRPRDEAFEFSGMELFTNGAGIIMLNASPLGWDEYIQRVHDLDALIVLARVAHHLHTIKATPEEIPAMLLVLPPELRDPFTGEAPRWNDGALEFQYGLVIEGDSIEPRLPFAPAG